MTPTEKYELDIKNGDISFDIEQSIVIENIETLYQELTATYKEKQGFIARYFSQKDHLITGIYLWGGVGRGKTYLIDGLYDCLPFKKKKRSHFHSFMLDVHNELRKLPKTPDPLKILAKSISETAQVLFLDEFHVHDIADAMLLHGLLSELICNKVTLVFTSNVPADQLYLNGIQREYFMSAIALIESHTKVLCLTGEKDYRREIADQSKIYHTLPEEQANELLNTYITNSSSISVTYYTNIIIHDRKINVIAVTDGVIWFDYNELFRTPRSAADYLDIAKIYHTVLISGISVMNEEDDNSAKRFIHFIDAVYDHNVKLVVNAEDIAEKIYTGKRLSFAFQRTISRLAEMGGEKYLARSKLLRSTS